MSGEESQRESATVNRDSDLIQNNDIDMMELNSTQNPTAEPNARLAQDIEMLRILQTDAKLSEAVIEDAIADNNLGALEVEYDDLMRYENLYQTTFLECCISFPPDVKNEEERKRTQFLKFVKSLRAKITSKTKISTSASNNESSNLKFEKINIDAFDGNRDDWLRFKTAFITYYHTSKLTDLEKHRTLFTKTKGEAHEVIREYPLDGSCYLEAFNALMDHFDDPLKTVTKRLDTMFSCPNVGTLSGKPTRKQTLRSLITTFRPNATALQLIFKEKTEIDPVSQFLIYAFLQKADRHTRIEWEREIQRTAKFATFKEFISFMEGRCNSFERAVGTSATNEPANTSTRQTSTFAMTTKRQWNKCPLCECNKHHLHRCPEFAKKDPAERFDIVRSKNLCRKCFRGNCKGSCPFTCRHCKGRHNSLIHVTSSGNFTLSIVGSLVTDSPYALLATSIVCVNSSLSDKRTVEARALLDSGSQRNFITTKLANAIRISNEIRSSSVIVKGVGNMQATYKKEMEIIIHSKVTDFSLKITCIIVEDIVDPVPQEYFSLDHWEFHQHLSLADPRFNIPNTVDLLLGVGVFWKILKPNFKDVGSSSLRLWATHLGWLVSGEVDLNKCTSDEPNYILMNQCDKSDLLARVIERFWLLDEPENKVSEEWSLEEQLCEEHFVSTTYRNEEGRFVVTLPFKSNKSNLGESRLIALKRFYALERKLARDEVYRQTYAKVVEDYITQGHMRLCTDSINEQQQYIIAHHAVIREDSSSTPLRVVFDASMKSTSGLSLNDCLMIGPVVQSELTSIIMRARAYNYVVSADIKQMYRQFVVRDEDCKFQRMFWRSHPSEPLKLYEHTRIVFGEACSPYLATRCLNKLADDADIDEYSLAKLPLRRDFYVDNLFSGSNSESELIQMKYQLVKLLASAKLQLSKWCSNSKELTKDIIPEELEKSFKLYSGSEFAIKTLGTIWLPKEDTFKVWVAKQNVKTHTKREILSVLSSVYDPVGLLSPVTIKAKLIMQSLWTHNLDWDSEIPESIKLEWDEFSQHLSSLNDILVDRHFFRHGTPQRIELHGFSDASEKAYGAVVYLRYFTTNGTFCALVSSKTRVAPLKRKTLPRLELCAALELAQLVHKIESNLVGIVKLDIKRLWTDSEIVLHWIKSPPLRWQLFVGNRVKKIQDLGTDHVWDYVQSQSNPADVISRGIYPSELIDFSLWWDGPQWLTNNSDPYNATVKFSKNLKDLPEVRKSVREYTSTLTCVDSDNFLKQYSSFTRLVRTTSWLIRFQWNATPKSPKLLGSLQYSEIERATLVLCRLVQSTSFANEVKLLKRGSELPKTSRLSALAPFLDKDGVIRVGGRIQHSLLSYEAQHQIILPPDSCFTKLLIKYEHERHLHAGAKLLGSVLRRKFWILRQIQAVKSCINKCKKCVTTRALTSNQTMGALPSSRVIPGRIFQTTGVDYSGPIKLRNKIGKRSVITDAYIVIFVCFATKAVHLELASDLTTESFMGVLDRFVSRRGVPNQAWSDNGRTFLGAKNVLRELYNFLHENGEIFTRKIIEQGCDWKFIPAWTPHMGGLWESGVKSIKRHLKRTLGSVALTYEQYETTLIMIEACLNSRPLTIESSDPNDPSALTPGHFLIGGPVTALPNPNITHVPVSKLKYWELTKQKTQQFWKRWSNEYLNSLQERTKWRINKKEINIGDIVVIKNDDSPPTHWPLGVVTSLHPGQDNIVRVVTLRTHTAKGIDFVKRHVSRLIHLP